MAKKQQLEMILKAQRNGAKIFMTEAGWEAFYNLVKEEKIDLPIAQ